MLEFQRSTHVNLGQAEPTPGSSVTVPSIGLRSVWFERQIRRISNNGVPSDDHIRDIPADDSTGDVSADDAESDHHSWIDHNLARSAVHWSSNYGLRDHA
jgi:hypothetical protein